MNRKASQSAVRRLDREFVQERLRGGDGIMRGHPKGVIERTEA